MQNHNRCPWASKEPEITYHDTEWGLPRRDDATQFEFLVLESAQAGLSWDCILKKREGYRRCFAMFNPEAVAAFTAADVERLMADPAIVRNRKKIESAISNARIFLELAAKHNGFWRYIWSFVDNKPIVNAWQRMEDVPATTPLSDAIAKELKQLGFTFLGSTIIYAHMQATGLVNDHLVTCFRHSQCACPDDKGA